MDSTFGYILVCQSPAMFLAALVLLISFLTRRRNHHVLAVAVLIFAMGFSLLYSRVIITELNADINAAETRLDVLHAEQVRMQTELDGKMSLKAIEEAAISEYGMVKPDGSQVSYVQVTTENKLEGKAKEEGFFEKIYQFIRDLFA